MSLADGCDAVGAYLSLADGGEESYQPQCDAACQYGCRLDGGDLRCQHVEDALEHKIPGKAVEALCTRHGGKNEEVSKLRAVFLECADSCIPGNGNAVGAADTRECNHDSDANIG